MFLNYLSPEEKKAFLQLAKYVARIDKNYSSEEKEIIHQYCVEMQIEDEKFDMEKFNLEEVLNQIKSEKSKKIVLMELISLILADDNITPEEKELLEKIIAKFNINRKLFYLYLEWARTMNSVFRQGQALLEV